MPLDPAQRHQIEQDAITASWETQCLAACDTAIALLREIADLERDDDGDLIIGADADGQNDLLSRVTTFLATNDQQGNPMIKLTETQTIVLTAGAQRPDNIALPLPKVLAGAAAKMAITKMISHGWLKEVDANLRRGEPLWRETGDGHGTTLVVTDAGLLAIGIEPAVAQRNAANHNRSDVTTPIKQPIQRTRSKQAMLIGLLQAGGCHHGQDHGCDRLAGAHCSRSHVRCLRQEAGAGRDLCERKRTEGGCIGLADLSRNCPRAEMPQSGSY